MASQPNLADTITAAGLPAVAVGTEFTVRSQDFLAGRPAGERLHFDISENRPEKLTIDYVRGMLMMYPRAVSELFAGQAMLDDLVRFTGRWRPQLVIWDALTYTGPIAAQTCGAVHVRSLFGPDHLARMRQVFHQLQAAGYDDPVRQWLAGRISRYGSEFGFDEELVLGQATIDPMPPCLRVATSARHIPVRFVPYSGRTIADEWLLDPPTRPLVCLTLGTSARDMGLRSPPVAELFEAVEGLDVDVIATMTRDQIGSCAVPDNVRLEGFVPLDTLLPRCSAIIHHFGAGSTSTAIVHGVPQLRVSDGLNLWGEPELAARLVGEGAALSIDAADLTPEIVADHLLKLLGDPSFRENAIRLRQEALAQPSPHDIVATLEELADV